MLSNFLPFVYGLSVFVLLFLAARIMLNGFFSGQASFKIQNSFSKKKGDDRTGLVTVHPELLDKDGSITDEDLLTVRFSKDSDHPQSYEKPSE
ncbi:conserved hypothetical protein [Prochlorococcus marinus str. NATL1A]|jgi:hypothetical protein|uniref:DUF2973 domain-containing protein n=1 Tax=Prochlorococcus marinus (strain NATL1A) TaxID=167555 RepID=A2BZR3_PROM1|nr:DUF2973 domain-containing protein [Prochlorococcus marinus]ABM74723.1 conserved hypothetical protein [Prochlorococcus marinus str. NATL1A]|tara:strand:- start:582 stop:860 length:279 start_codon:yes stop_codon:yes gene_type:complete